jgi:hypothetical protein
MPSDFMNLAGSGFHKGYNFPLSCTNVNAGIEML